MNCKKREREREGEGERKKERKRYLDDIDVCYVKFLNHPTNIVYAVFLCFLLERITQQNIRLFVL